MWKRIRGWFSAVSESEIERELRSHLEAEADELEESGVPREQARRAARLAFGNPLVAREQVREVWVWIALEHWIRDFHLAARASLRRPGFLLLAVAALAAGTGATTAMFAIVHATLLRPLPYPDPDGIVVLNDQLLSDRKSLNLASPGQVAAWTEEAKSFARIGAATDAFFILTGGGQESVRIPALLASPGLLEILGARVSHGRLYTDAGGASEGRLLLVSEALWRRRFGSAKLRGQTLEVNGEAHEIVGILPESIPLLGRRYDALRRLSPPATLELEARQRLRYLTVLGRLRPGATIQSAAGELAAVAGRLGTRFPATDAGRVVAVTPLDEVERGATRPRILFAMVAVCTLLLIACLNVGSLMVGRNLARTGEIRVRLALGAGRGDVFRQFACEGILLALAGTAVGLALARGGLAFFVQFAPAEILRLGEPRLSTPVLLFAGLVAACAALGVVMVPLPQLFSMRRDGLREGCRGAWGSQGVLARHALLGAEVALAVLLIVSAGTTVQTLLRLLRTDPGYHPAGAMAVELSTSPGNRSEVAFLRAMIDAVATIPGLRSAAITNRLPLGDDRSTRPVNLGSKAEPSRQEMVEIRRVSPGFFDAMGMRLVRGRLLSGQDTPESARVALVNERFVRRFLGTADPVGRQLLIQEGRSPTPAVIVGVVNDLRNASLAADPQPEVYLSIFVHPSPNVALIVRGAGSTAAVLPEVRRRLARLDPSMPLAAAMPLEDLIQNQAAPHRSLAYLLSVFSLLAVALAAVGIYGVSTFAVMGRVGEIGIRMALGAGPLSIIALVLRRVAQVVTMGMAGGVVLSLAAYRWAQTILAGVDAPRPAGVGVALLVFSVAVVLASIGPALRASSVDPASAQRN